jgi:hypothetical protein
MARERDSLPCPTMEEVQRQFDAWRKTRKRRTSIPALLWEAAVGLAGRYSPHRISKTLRLNHTELRKRIDGARAADNAAASPAVDFVEYSIPVMGNSGCLIEMEGRHGDKMRIFLAGERPVDLVGLGRSFWSRDP